VCLLLAIGWADETTEVSRTHDELGFPITYNDEIITENDVLRSLGLPEGEVPKPTLENQRNLLLYRKISEQIAASLGIEVEEAEVKRRVEFEIGKAGGEAKWYEELAQKGRTLGRERLEIAQQLLDNKLQFLFQVGHINTRTGSKLLPWRIGPTPREIRIAYRNDPARRTAGLRVRRLELNVDLSRKERVKLAMQSGGNLSQDQLEERVKKLLEPRLATVREELEDKSFEIVARRYGTEVDKQRDEWLEIPQGESGSPIVRFLRDAKVGARSEPLRQTGGGYKILYLLERQDPRSRPASDPEVAREYDLRIRALRAQKWEAFLRLRALDEATVRPERVRQELRAAELSRLRDAEQRLQALGLH